jgi:histidyl-tRNA synthetase
VLVTIWDEQSADASLAVATELRRAGLRVDLYAEADKIGKQFKYASSRGIPFVVVAGADERANGLVSLKNMNTGEQTQLPCERVAETIRGKL